MREQTGRKADLMVRSRRNSRGAVSGRGWAASGRVGVGKAGSPFFCLYDTPAVQEGQSHFFWDGKRAFQLLDRSPLHESNLIYISSTSHGVGGRLALSK